MNEEQLKDRIYEICEIIHMQLPLRYQDRWVERQVEDGLFNSIKIIMCEWGVCYLFGGEPWG